MPKTLLSLGAIGLIACFVWWSMFYTEILRVSGRLESTKTWQEGVGMFSHCLFWDRPQCVAAKTDFTPYEPLFLWLSFGVLLGGTILKIQHAWKAGHRRGGRPPADAQQR